MPPEEEGSLAIFLNELTLVQRRKPSDFLARQVILYCSDWLDGVRLESAEDEARPCCADQDEWSAYPATRGITTEVSQVDAVSEACTCMFMQLP